ncbi:MAG: hypothetical protein F6K17_41160 [Okeania sp. SIO3C4]|nr:hypothetical protein [Okeania sp. SIO3C4]
MTSINFVGFVGWVEHRETQHNVFWQNLSYREAPLTLCCTQTTYDPITLVCWVALRRLTQPTDTILVFVGWRDRLTQPTDTILVFVGWRSDA